jgi:tetratricopeptide (TPR) repeat protein
MNGGEPRWRHYVLWIGAIASFVLSNLAFDFLKSLEVGGWIGGVEYLVVAVLIVFWLMIYGPSAWQEFQSWRTTRHDGVDPPTPASPSAELRSSAEQAERWLVALGSERSGMAASGWFEQEEPALRNLLFTAEVGPEAADDLARICDALEACYVRGRRPDDLLELSERLATIGEQVRRRDLEELAAVRAATAYRLRGDLDAAASQLEAASKLAAPGPTAAAMRTRRALERGLLHLARADRYPPGADRDDAVLNARDRFDEARLAVPRADLAADIAIHLNRAVVCLYRHDTDRALDHLRLAEARASASDDVSAYAHALELLGVRAWLLNNPRQAILWWWEAQHRYADVDEREGAARCLQHLGSAELVNGNGSAALVLLERSAKLRGGTQGHELLERYLAQARSQVGKDAEAPVRPDIGLHRIDPLGRLRMLWRKLTS